MWNPNNVWINEQHSWIADLYTAVGKLTKLEYIYYNLAFTNDIKEGLVPILWKNLTSVVFLKVPMSMSYFEKLMLPISMRALRLNFVTKITRFQDYSTLMRKIGELANLEDLRLTINLDIIEKNELEASYWSYIANYVLKPLAKLHHLKILVLKYADQYTDKKCIEAFVRGLRLYLPSRVRKLQLSWPDAIVTIAEYQCAEQMKALFKRKNLGVSIKINVEDISSDA